MATAVNPLTAFWRAREWHRFVPLARAFVHRWVPHAVVFDYDTTEDIATWITVRCWALPFVPDDAEAFVRTLCRTRALDVLKNVRETRREPMPDADDSPTWIDPASERRSALDAIISADDATQLRDALGHLPPDYRRVLYLHDIHGRGLASLAEQFATTEGAMKMRVHRARRMLGHVMRQRWGTPPTKEEDAVRDRSEHLGLYAVTDMGRAAGRMMEAPPERPRAAVARRGRPFMHRCRCGDPACAVIAANAANAAQGKP